MATPVVYRTIREQIVEQVRKEVLSGELAEGISLREQQLAARFGVSRGPIRDALLQLTQEGLLVSQPNRGVRVCRAPSQVIQPLVVGLRRHIELFALAAIFDALTDEDVERLASLVDRLREACARGDMSECVEHDIAMHRWIVERAQDADLLALWLSTVVRMRLKYTRHASLMDCHAEHRRVLDAVRARDKQAALAALEANIV